MKLASLSARARRNLWIMGVMLVLFTITGFFILPPIVKSQLEKHASAALGRPVTVGKVRVNPYTLSLTLENLAVREQGGKGSILGWNRLYVNFDALASLTGDWVLSEIELDGFHAGGERSNGEETFRRKISARHTVRCAAGQGPRCGCTAARAEKGIPGTRGGCRHAQGSAQ